MIVRKKAPYSDTKVPAEQSRMEIDRLLRGYGIQDFQWTEAWSKGVVKLRFAIESADHKWIAIEVVPPPFTARRKTWDPKKGYTTIESPNWAQSMRCLLHWLKAKLEQVAYGLKSVEEEFLADLVVKDAHGQDTTVGKLVVPALSDGRLELPQLTGARPDRRDTAQDAEGRVVS